MGNRVEEHSFSVELKSENVVRKISFLDDENERVLFEGYLGKLKNISMVEGMMLEVEGENGTLRLDITQPEIERCHVKKSIQTEGEQN